MIRAVAVLALVSIPACAALTLPDGALAWYVMDSALVAVLLYWVQRGQPLPVRAACWFGMLVHVVVAGYGLADESGAVSATGLWVLLAGFALAAEIVARGTTWAAQKL